MKTTIHIPDSLLAEARELARRDHTTLKALVEEGLRYVVEHRARSKPFKLRDGTFEGKGLHPEVADGSWDRIRELIYSGRGG